MPFRATRLPRRLGLVPLFAVAVTQCQPAPGLAPPAASPSETISPDPATAEATFLTRQFDPSELFASVAPYPPEVLAEPDSNFVRMDCSPPYFSWSGDAHENVDPDTGEKHTISDPMLLGFLQSARMDNPGKTITSISYCRTDSENALVVFGVGPCGGGCSGIPHIAYGEPDGSLRLLATVEPDGDGAYFGCAPLQLSRSGTIDLACQGEGTAILRRVDASTGAVEVLLRCATVADALGCSEP